MTIYEMVIGLEVHVELSTKTKIFCSCSTAFGAEPNTQVCPVCLGMPGALPMFNKRVADLALAVCLATECDITTNTVFDRKNYFYPDNPQNYQISQLYSPIGRNGRIVIDTEKGEKVIGIHEMHMEEDAGKLLHREDGTTLIDFNRSGVPLLEIVSEADFSSAQEVVSYLENLRQILVYLGASDGKLQEGSMRVDVNLSVRPQGRTSMGTRTEMKNLNSFRAISHAIEAEKSRQVALLEAGKEVLCETRRWDEDAGCSYPMRIKECVEEYRYFPDPDLYPLRIMPEWIEQVRKSIPELPAEKRKRYAEEYGLSKEEIRLLTQSPETAKLWEDTVVLGADPSEVAHWITGEGLRLLKEINREADKLRISPEHLAGLLSMVDKGEINRTTAKEIFALMFAKNIDPVIYVRENNLFQIGNEKELEETVRQILRENPKSVTDFYEGKKKAKGFLVGQTMKAMQGKADPLKVNLVLTRLLENRN